MDEIDKNLSGGGERDNQSQVVGTMLSLLVTGKQYIIILFVGGRNTQEDKGILQTGNV